jgi:SAM-dependent methyltransferase
VHNWIDAAKHGKIDLHLYDNNGRVYVANIPDNITILERLAAKGKKYRNTLHQKVVTPTDEFYKLFSRRQILDIIHNLNIHHEIPRQYNYFDGGAISWDAWLKRLEHDETPNILKNTIELMRSNLGSIDYLVGNYKYVNVVDVGVGNAMPVKEFLAHLLEQGILARYIAIDLSEDMLRIAESNIKEWFGDKVKFEGYIRDIGFERFDDLLVDDMLGNEANQTINVMLLLGATPTNFINPSDILKVVYGSMGNDDLLIYSDKYDTEVSRQYFDFSIQPGSTGLSPKYSAMLRLLNIDESLYDVEMGFNEQKRMRYVRIRLKAALTIKFTFENSERNVSLEKNDTILLLRVWHNTMLEHISAFEKTGFKLLQASTTKDRQYLLTISGVEVEQEPSQVLRS